MYVEAHPDIARVMQSLKKLGEQGPFAMALALTRTAQAIKKAEEEEIRRVFKSPTPYTQRSVYYLSARKTNLNARVWLKDRSATAKGGYASEYLAPQIFGGNRLPKKFEYLLRGAGVLPPGMFAVPGQGATMDGYGNMSRGQLVRVLSAVRALRDPMQHRRQGKRSSYFVSRGDRGRPRGIWLRTGHSVKSILMFVRNPHYRARFDFYGVGMRTIDKVFKPQFAAAFAKARETARI